MKSMYLLLNPSNEENIALQLRKASTTPLPSTVITYSHSEELLGIIDGFLQSQKITPQQLEGIIIVNDAPTFTTIRNIITILNTMAWHLGIPLVGISSEQGLKRALASIAKKKQFKLLLPCYSAPPRITLPKDNKE